MASATLDASSGRIRRFEDIAAYTRVRDPERVNPATGPVAVRGAEPGDELRVEILEIEVGDVGWARLTPGAGVMRDELDALHGMIFRVEGGELHTDVGISLPVRPMVGVIGTCPTAGRYPTARPGL